MLHSDSTNLPPSIQNPPPYGSGSDALPRVMFKPERWIGVASEADVKEGTLKIRTEFCPLSTTLPDTSARITTDRESKSVSVRR